MNIPRQVLNEEFYAWLSTPEGPKPGDGSTVDYGFDQGFKQGAEWARKEVLLEAKAALRGEGEPGHPGEFISVNHAQELLEDLVGGDKTDE